MDKIVLIIIVIIIILLIIIGLSGSQNLVAAKYLASRHRRCRHALIDKLVSDENGTAPQFGAVVRISGNGQVAIVGGYRADGAQSFQGALYVYTKNVHGWELQQKITADDGMSNDLFALSADISENGSVVVVGSYANLGTGSAYIFRRIHNTWGQERKLLASDGNGGDLYGRAVSISPNGHYVAIGAPNMDTNGMNSGAVYVYERIGGNWIESKLLASDGVSLDQFGFSVALNGSGGYLAAGAIGRQSSSGAIYIFKRQGSYWNEIQKLESPYSNLRFGWSVGISYNGNVIIAGSYSKVSTDNGRAYIFSRSGSSMWGDITLLQPSDSQTGDRFGFSVSVDNDGNNIIVGAPLGNDGVGSSYLFKKLKNNEWREECKLDSHDGQSGDFYGSSVSISASCKDIIVGASTSLDFYGSAYIFKKF